MAVIEVAAQDRPLDASTSHPSPQRAISPIASRASPNRTPTAASAPRGPGSCVPTSEAKTAHVAAPPAKKATCSRARATRSPPASFVASSAPARVFGSAAAEEAGGQPETRAVPSIATATETDRLPSRVRDREPAACTERGEERGGGEGERPRVPGRDPAADGRRQARPAVASRSVPTVVMFTSTRVISDASRARARPTCRAKASSRASVWDSRDPSSRTRGAIPAGSPAGGRPRPSPQQAVESGKKSRGLMPNRVKQATAQQATRRPGRSARRLGFRTKARSTFHPSAMTNPQPSPIASKTPAHSRELWGTKVTVEPGERRQDGEDRGRRRGRRRRRRQEQDPEDGRGAPLGDPQPPADRRPELGGTSARRPTRRPPSPSRSGAIGRPPRDPDDRARPTDVEASTQTLAWTHPSCGYGLIIRSREPGRVQGQARRVGPGARLRTSRRLGTDAAKAKETAAELKKG